VQQQQGGNRRSSRWDRTAAPWDGSGGGPPTYQPPPGIAVPDVSKPPPGFPLPPAQQSVVEEKETIPTLPYFELPAGLMVSLIKMEDSDYKPLDPTHIRMPPPQPPNERLLAAVELFYAPPSHERPRDPEGWEKLDSHVWNKQKMASLGLYEWTKEKQAAIKKKKDDIDMGLRERSPTLSPDRGGDSTPEQIVPDKEKSGEKRKQRKRYRSQTRSRSRTRSNSGSRGSTPDRRQERRRRKGRDRSVSRSRSPSGSPTGGYSLPSYLTKRSPSQGRSPSPRRRSTSPRRRSPSPRKRSKSPRRRSTSPRRRSSSPRRRSSSPDRSRRRSPSPSRGHQVVDSRLDGSNKGHQMMQKMGWKGAGLGSQESGITDPISGGDVREKQDQYKGVGISMNDPYESFRKQRAGAFYTRMRDKADERSDRRDDRR